jgi:hypothetical protein
VIIAVDFDGTVVDDSRPYADTTSPLRLLPGAKEGLAALKKARHTLILWSARSNRALREDPALDPLVRAGVKKLDRAAWEQARPLHQGRYEQMLSFVKQELPNIFDAIDDGTCGKVAAQLYIDNNALRFGRNLSGMGWPAIAVEYGVQARRVG